ncbi:MAG TPA: hypothetical protein VFP84_12890 [Kofleriaceae bacterium]|nr:hypothetical protein [Kofleriaceae bacterium]
MTLPPCLVVESIVVDPGQERASAELRIGPRRVWLIIEYSIPGIWHFRKMPSELDRSIRPKRAVMELMARAYNGEAVSLPHDLSHTVRGIDEPWPLWVQDEHRTSEPMAISVTDVELDAAEPPVATVHMQVLGVPTVVAVDNRKTQQEWTYFRFISGVHPWQLTDAEAWAMLVAIANAVPGGVVA